jgi:uncharacterized protein YciI
VKLSIFLSLVLSFGIATAQDFTIVFLNKKLDKAELPEAEVKKLMDGHMANMARLAKEDKLWAAGPFDGGGGIFIFKSGSLDDVREWIKTDPGIAAKRWDIEILPFKPRYGSVCAVGEKYEMTNYYFVRYSHPGMTDDVDTNSAHQVFIKSWIEGGGVIAEESLGAGQGSILVLKEEPSADKIASDPAVKGNKANADVKKLFIAKGSFCEPK